MQQRGFPTNHCTVGDSMMTIMCKLSCSPSPSKVGCGIPEGGTATNLAGRSQYHFMKKREGNGIQSSFRRTSNWGHVTCCGGLARSPP
eukprot:scaffold764_cov93-Skeletonema_dohrnii-CCMP3373.AAC.1